MTDRATPLPLGNVNHVSFETGRLEVTIDFYVRVMGFREVWRPPFSFRGAWLFGHGIMIHLIEGTSTSRTSVDSRSDHLAFHTDQPDEIGLLLDRHGIPYRRHEQSATGVVQYFFLDPDGHQMEVAQYPPMREK